MAYSPEALQAKLASLNETQDSITAVAQWILFHKRQAADSSRTWASYAVSEAAETANQRLALVYLANEVVQQSKARRKPDFFNAWAAQVPPVVANVYTSADKQTQDRIRRVNRVWRDRQVFDEQQQAQINAALGIGPPAGPPIPQDLTSLVNLWLERTQADASAPLSSLEDSLRDAEKQSHPLKVLEALQSIEFTPFEALNSATSKAVAELERLLEVLRSDPRLQLSTKWSSLHAQNSELVREALPTDPSPSIYPLTAESGVKSQSPPSQVSERSEAPEETPETEVAPSVYTAQNAARNYASAEEPEEPEYAPDSDFEGNNDAPDTTGSEATTEPAAKKPKLDLDPQLASFLASMSGQTQQ